MTLVAARSDSGQLCIVADTRLSRVGKPLAPLAGALKVLVLRPDLCVGFAGDSTLALTAIGRLVSGPPAGTAQVVASLLRDHLDGGGRADFIVATCGDELALHCVAGGQVSRRRQECTVGDAAASDEFLHHYRRPDLISGLDTDVFVFQMWLALTEVILNGNHPSVGDFAVVVRSSPGGFRYQPFTAVRPAWPKELRAEGDMVEMGVEPASTGGYAYAILAPVEGGPAIGVYYYQARLGALFYPLRAVEVERDPLGAELYCDVGIDRFVHLVWERHRMYLTGGVPLAGTMSP